MKRLLAVWFFLLSGSVCAQTLTVCAEPWKPFIYRDSAGQAAGLAVKVLQNAAKSSGDLLEYRFMSLAGCRKLMQQGKVDVFAFAEPGLPPKGWISSRELLVAWLLYAWVPVTSPMQSYSRPEIVGKKVAWVGEYAYPQGLTDAKDFVRVHAVDADESIRLLAGGRIDLVFDDPAATDDFGPEITQRVRRLEPMVVSFNQPIWLRAGLEGLRGQIDRETLRIQADDSLNDFYQNYMGVSLQEVQQHLQGPSTAP